MELLVDEPLDLVILLRSLAGEVARASVEYVSAKASLYQARLRERQRRADPLGERVAGTVKALRSDKGFGFVTSDGEDFFLHFRDLLDVRSWDGLEEGEPCVFEPKLTERGPRATRIRILSV